MKAFNIVGRKSDLSLTLPFSLHPLVHPTDSVQERTPRRYTCYTYKQNIWSSWHSSLSFDVTISNEEGLYSCYLCTSMVGIYWISVFDESKGLTRAVWTFIFPGQILRNSGQVSNMCHSVLVGCLLIRQSWKHDSQPFRTRERLSWQHNIGV